MTSYICSLIEYDQRCVQSGPGETFLAVPLPEHGDEINDKDCSTGCSYQSYALSKYGADLLAIKEGVPFCHSAVHNFSEIGEKTGDIFSSVETKAEHLSRRAVSGSCASIVIICIQSPSK